MLGFTTPGDEKVPVPVRNWAAMKRGLWRSREACEIAARAAAEIIERCSHVPGCPGARNLSEPCIQDRYEANPESTEETPLPAILISKGCADRETRMAALVILNAVQAFAPLDARRPTNEPYFAPSREYFSEVISELAIAQTENEVLREALRSAGVTIPTPLLEEKSA